MDKLDRSKNTEILLGLNGTSMTPRQIMRKQTESYYDVRTRSWHHVTEADYQRYKKEQDGN